MTDTAIPQMRDRGASDSPSHEGAYERKRQANEHMRQGLHRLDPGEQIPFFCECDDSECFSAVWLTGLAYDLWRSSAAARILMRAHRVNAVTAA